MRVRVLAAALAFAGGAVALAQTPPPERTGEPVGTVAPVDPLPADRPPERPLDPTPPSDSPPPDTLQTQGKLIPPEDFEAPPVSPDDAAKPKTQGRLIPPEDMPPLPGSQASVPPAPLGPPVPQLLRESDFDLSACKLELTVLGATFEDAAGITNPADRDCGIARPIRVTEILPGLALEGGADMRCDTARALAHWTRDFVQPAAARLPGAPRVTAMTLGTTYFCRPVVGGASTSRLSEHAVGNAIDIAAFRFDDGTDLTVAPREDSGDLLESFQAAVRGSACMAFTTVLGPGSNDAHSDHLHLDIKARDGGYRLCQRSAASARVVADFQVGRVEPRQPRQPIPRQDLDLGPLPADQLAVAQVTHRPVDVDRGIAQNLGHFALQQRNRHDAIARCADRRHPHVKFADEMRQMGAGAKDRACEQPLPVNGGVDGRGHPEQPREVREMLGHLGELGMVDELDLDPAERHDRMVEFLQDKGVQIDEIARNVQGGDGLHRRFSRKHRDPAGEP